MADGHQQPAFLTLMYFHIHTIYYNVCHHGHAEHGPHSPPRANLHSKALAKYVYPGQRQAAEIPIYGYCAYGLNLLLLQL